MKGTVPVTYIPWKSKDHEFNSLSEKTIILVGIYNQQFQGTIILMATSHDQNPKKSSFLEGKSPAISGRSRLMQDYNPKDPEPSLEED